MVESILIGEDELKGLGLDEIKKNSDGSDAGRGLKLGVKYVWHFEGSNAARKLVFEVQGVQLTKTQKDAIKALADTKFGADKVEVL